MKKKIIKKLQRFGLSIMIGLLLIVTLPGFRVTLYSEVNIYSDEFESNDLRSNKTEQISNLIFTFPKNWKARTAFENNVNDGTVIDKRVIIEDNKGNLITIDSWRNPKKLSLNENYEKLEGIFFNKQKEKKQSLSYPISYSSSESIEKGTIMINSILNSEEKNQLYSNFFQNGDNIYRVMFIYQKNEELDNYVKFLKSLKIDGEKIFNEEKIQKIKFPKIKNEISLNMSKVFAVDSCGGYTMAGNIFPCCSNGGNCTWWAIYRRPDLKDVITWGNAGQDWINQAQQGGYPIAQNPTVDAIVVWDDINFDPAVSGHVAQIVEIATDNYFKVSQMSCGSIYPYGAYEEWVTPNYLGTNYPLIGFIGHKNISDLVIQNQTINQGEYNAASSITILPATNIIPVNGMTIVFKIQ